MIYVDAIQHYPQCRLPYKDWCHMATDASLEELHHKAARLGLRRAWFQNKLTHPHYDLTPGKRAQAIRPGARAVSTPELLTALLSAHPGQRVTATHEGGIAMKTPKRNEQRSVPDDGQTRVSPQEPMQRDAASIFLHVLSRGNASQAGIVPVDSRRSPSVSQVPPAFSRRFPSVDQAHMLQPSVGSCDRVRIYPVMWMSIEALKQERQA